MEDNSRKYNWKYNWIKRENIEKKSFIKKELEKGMIHQWTFFLFGNLNSQHLHFKLLTLRNEATSEVLPICT